MHAMINPYVAGFFDLFCVLMMRSECVGAFGEGSIFQNWVLRHFQAEGAFLTQLFVESCEVAHLSILMVRRLAYPEISTLIGTEWSLKACWCRAVASSTVGPVSTRPIFGAPWLILAHTTIDSTTGRPVGSYVFSCQTSRLVRRCLQLLWKRYVLL